MSLIGLFYSCKGQKGEPEKNKQISSKEIFIGKKFYSGDELSDFEYVDGNRSQIDSISYSIYKPLINEEQYVFSLEKLISNDDVEYFEIIDTIHLKTASFILLNYESDVLTLIQKERKIKSWIYNNNKKKIPETWFGIYSLNIDYGKLDEFSKMSIQYDVSIFKDSCTFSGMGYKTYFTDKCFCELGNNKLYVKYLKQIEGDLTSQHLNIDTLAIIEKQNDKYYIKSPIIADKDWNYNIKMEIPKD